MPNSKQIVYLSQAQYAELITNGTITVNGVTVTYDENDIYVTPQAEPVTDVRVNGTSVSSNGIANIPTSGYGTYGVVKLHTNVGNDGLRFSDGNLGIYPAFGSDMKQGRQTGRPITPSTQDAATFYGLAKVAGHDEKDSTESVGTYTPEAKGAIQQMLGVSDLIATSENDLTASKAYAIGDVFTANGKLYKATAAIAADAAIIPAVEGETVAGANCEETSVGDGFVKKTDIASRNEPGLVKTNAAYGTQMFGDVIATSPCNDNYIKLGTHEYNPIVSAKQHQSVFYGLAKAAGDATQAASDNAVGTYTDGAKASIQHMLGTDTNLAPYESDTTADAAYAIGEMFMLNGKLHQATAAIAIGDTLTVGTNCAIVNASEVFPHDVQVNGTSVVTDGVANIPIAINGSYGLVKPTTTYGVNIINGYIGLRAATDTQIKEGIAVYATTLPNKQHAAAFYGLAYAAGDTTQSASTNAVGTYTDNAKASIKSMLGIVDGSTGTVNITGATPTINAVENTRYVCGEVTSLSFTPPSSGISIVRFTSGSTVTVLTIPNTVKFPEWFDPTTLETNTIYEICVTDGTFGAVMSWAL